MNEEKSVIQSFEVGELVVLSCGEYSDYSIYALFRVKKRFEPRELFQRWFDLVPLNEWGHKYFNEEDLTEYLVQEEYIERIEYFEWHFGAYFTIGDMKITIEKKDGREDI